MGRVIKHPVPDRIKLSFVIFDIRALWRSGLSVRVPVCQKNYKWRLNLLWHRVLYSCTHMATVGIKGLIHCNIYKSNVQAILVFFKNEMENISSNIQGGPN